jgi:hypothetical protein
MQKRRSHNQLIQFLKDSGIRPSSFAFFLAEYVKKHPSANKSALSFLVAAQLKEQAEIIMYHLNH